MICGLILGCGVCRTGRSNTKYCTTTFMCYKYTLRIEMFRAVQHNCGNSNTHKKKKKLGFSKLRNLWKNDFFHLCFEFKL